MGAGNTGTCSCRIRAVWLAPNSLHTTASSGLRKLKDAAKEILSHPHPDIKKAYLVSSPADLPDSPAPIPAAMRRQHSLGRYAVKGKGPPACLVAKNTNFTFDFSTANLGNVMNEVALILPTVACCPERRRDGCCLMSHPANPDVAFVFRGQNSGPRCVNH